jgi:hypothetical protein
MKHITIAASPNAFTQLFNRVRDNYKFSKADGGSFGPFSANYSVNMHLSGGSVQLNDDDTVEVKNLDINWDTLTLNLCFNLPCIPAFCLVPDPWNGCLVGTPQICIAGPICIPIDLSGLVSKVSDVKANLAAIYFVDPARDPSWSDLDAEFNGHPNYWRIFLHPVFVHVDPIDIPKSLGNIIENLVKDAIKNSLPGPGWLKDILLAALGPILDALKVILGFVDDITSFISDLLGRTFDLLGIIETAIADYFASKYPLTEFEDPHDIKLPTGGGLIPVKIPIRDLDSHVNSKEMIVEANIGA